MSVSPRSLEEADIILDKLRLRADLGYRAQENLINAIGEALDRAKAEQREEDARIAEDWEGFFDASELMPVTSLCNKIASAIRSTAKEEK